MITKRKPFTCLMQVYFACGQRDAATLTESSIVASQRSKLPSQVKKFVQVPVKAQRSFQDSYQPLIN